MTVFAVCVGLSGHDDVASSPIFDRHVAALAGSLSESVRGGDLVARTGLHEFTVVGTIPRATAEASAAVVLERLHARCARGATQAGPRARLDIGFAVARIGEFDPQALLAEAEDGLFA
jgi:GGDEF domain-containing protein